MYFYGNDPDGNKYQYSDRVSHAATHGSPVPLPRNITGVYKVDITIENGVSQVKSFNDTVMNGKSISKKLYFAIPTHVL